MKRNMKDDWHCHSTHSVFLSRQMQVLWWLQIWCSGLFCTLSLPTISIRWILWVIPYAILGTLTIYCTVLLVWWTILTKVFHTHYFFPLKFTLKTIIHYIYLGIFELWYGSIYNLMVCDFLSLLCNLVTFETHLFFGTHVMSSAYVNKEIKTRKNIKPFCLPVLLMYLLYMI